jgi:hypothetical protein
VAVRRDVPEHLELVSRSTADATYLFAINHGRAAVDLPIKGVDVLTAESYPETAKIAAEGVRVFRLPAP